MYDQQARTALKAIVEARGCCELYHDADDFDIAIDDEDGNGRDCCVVSAEVRARLTAALDELHPLPAAAAVPAAPEAPPIDARERAMALLRGEG